MKLNATLIRAASLVARRMIVGRVPKLFDRDYYLRSDPELAASGLDPYLHYVWFGASKGRDPAEDFDTEFYRRQSGQTRLDPVRHYIKRGVRAGFDPSPNFSTSAYLMRYPDVVASGSNPLLHYRTHGRREGREAQSAIDNFEKIAPLEGLKSRYIHTFPNEEGRSFQICLLQDLPIDLDYTHAKRLCFLLKLTNEEIYFALYAFRSDRTNKNIILEMALSSDTQSSLNTLLIAFDNCYVAKSNDKNTVTFRYGEARLWDLRKPAPSMIEAFVAGAIEFGPGSGA